MKSILFQLVFILTCHSNLYGVGFYSKGDTLNVLAASGLRLRDKPSINGNVVATIPCGEIIVMLGNGGSTDPKSYSEKIEGIGGQWAKVSWQGKEGYVFDGFLSWLPAPTTGFDFLNRFFRKRGEAVRFDNRIDGEGRHSVTIQYYDFKGRRGDLLICVEQHSGWEWGETRFNLVSGSDGISDVEFFLFVTLLFREKIQNARKQIATGEFKPMDGITEQNGRNNQNYYNFFPPDLAEGIEYYLPTQEGETFNFGINKR